MKKSFYVMKILFVVSLIFNVLLVTPNVLWMLRRLKFDTMMRQSIFDSGLKKEIDAGVKFDYASKSDTLMVQELKEEYSLSYYRSMNGCKCSYSLMTKHMRSMKVFCSNGMSITFWQNKNNKKWLRLNYNGLESIYLSENKMYLIPVSHPSGKESDGRKSK